MDHELKIRTKLNRLVAYALSVAVLGTALVGCTGGTAKPSAAPSSPHAAQALPSMPKVPENLVVIRENRGSGSHTFRSATLSAKALTVQLACAAPGKSSLLLKLFQTGTKPIYQIGHQPCDGTVQKITLTADTTAPIRADVSAPSATMYGLLITQR